MFVSEERGRIVIEPVPSPDELHGIHAGELEPGEVLERVREARDEEKRREAERVDGAPTDASLREADRDVRTLERRGMSIEPADWRLAADVKADGAVSLADAYAVALASERDGTLVAGADDDFDELPVEIDLHRFREHGV